MGRGSRSGAGRSSFGSQGRSSSSRSSYSGGGRSSRSYSSRSSYSSGGRSSGSYSSRPSYSSSRSYSSRSHRPSHVHVSVGNSYYSYGSSYSAPYGSSKNDRKGALICFMFIFAIFFFSFAALSVSDVAYHQESVNIARVDYEFYQDMIDEARENGYIVNGVVNNKYYDYELDRWYITYSLPYEYYTYYETFSVYTQEEVDQYDPGDSIEIALDRKEISLATESIDLNFENVEFKDFSLARLARQERNKAILVMIIEFSVAGGLIVGAIFLIKSTRKEGKENKEKTVTPLVKEPTVVTCKYCGSEHSIGTRKCANCGASVKEK